MYVLNADVCICDFVCRGEESGSYEWIGDANFFFLRWGRGWRCIRLRYFLTKCDTSTCHAKVDQITLFVFRIAVGVGVSHTRREAVRFRTIYHSSSVILESLCYVATYYVYLNVCI